MCPTISKEPLQQSVQVPRCWPSSNVDDSSTKTVEVADLRPLHRDGSQSEAFSKDSMPSEVHFGQLGAKDAASLAGEDWAQHRAIGAFVGAVAGHRGGTHGGDFCQPRKIEASSQICCVSWLMTACQMLAQAVHQCWIQQRGGLMMSAVELRHSRVWQLPWQESWGRPKATQPTELTGSCQDQPGQRIPELFACFSVLQALWHSRGS